MKIYRISYRNHLSEHEGYGYFANKKLAEKEHRKDIKKRKKASDAEDISDEEYLKAQTEDEVETLELAAITKKEIISFLNQYGGHPNNG